PRCSCWACGATSRGFRCDRPPAPADGESGARARSTDEAAMRVSRIAPLAWYALLLFWSVVVLFPLVFMVSTAFKVRGDVFPNVKYLPWLQFQPTLSAWTYLFTDFRQQITDAFMTSLLAALGSAIAATFLGALAGYA